MKLTVNNIKGKINTRKSAKCQSQSEINSLSASTKREIFTRSGSFYYGFEYGFHSTGLQLHHNDSNSFLKFQYKQYITENATVLLINKNGS